MTNKSETFNKQLSYIEDEELKTVVRLTLAMVPDYFYEMPASTTGKYHPEYSLGKGGLVRHTKAAVKLAHDLLLLEQNKEMKEKYGDEIIAALILHDSVKKGMNGGNYTTSNHPLEASCLFFNVASTIGYKKTENVCRLINSHMGQWNYDRNGVEILPKPKTQEEMFVHQCDYLASRKYLTVNFEEGE